MNIWVNGCFDILHTGHLELLEYAKNFKVDGFVKEGVKNKLIIGIDSDERVKQLKGDNRPINSVLDRYKMLTALKFVDLVVVFNTDDELRNKIKHYSIDYIVVGDHYIDKEVIGSKESKFGVVYYRTDLRSTTSLIDRIKNEARLEVFENMCEEFKDDAHDVNFNNYAVGNLRKLRSL